MSIHIPSSNGETVEPAVKTTLPKSLPILPLRDSVPFPETLTPLAIGQERSIALVNDVLTGDRMLVMLASRCLAPPRSRLFFSRHTKRGRNEQCRALNLQGAATGPDHVTTKSITLFLPDAGFFGILGQHFRAKSQP